MNHSTPSEESQGNRTSGSLPGRGRTMLAALSLSLVIGFAACDSTTSSVEPTLKRPEGFVQRSKSPLERSTLKNPSFKITPKLLVFETVAGKNHGAKVKGRSYLNKGKRLLGVDVTPSAGGGPLAVKRLSRDGETVMSSESDWKRDGDVWRDGR